jgi:hypothetical protein
MDTRRERERLSRYNPDLLDDDKLRPHATTPGKINEGPETAFNRFQHQFSTGKPLKNTQPMVSTMSNRALLLGSEPIDTHTPLLWARP